MRGIVRPANVYDPPKHAPSRPETGDALPVFRDATSLESAQYSQVLIPGVGVERSVFSSSGRWRGCDVFLTASTPVAGAEMILTVKVYAVTKGHRVLLTTGRYVAAGTGAKFTASPPDSWVAAARAGAATFEVTITSWVAAGAAPPAGSTYTISIVCTDQLVDPPDDVGTITSLPATSLALNDNATSTAAPSALELVAVRAACSAAGARFLHAHSSPVASNTPAGLAPAMTWPMGSAAGDGVVESRIGFRVPANMQIAISSTVGATTLAGDGEFTATLR
jgi:hypothetical protein